MRVLPTYTRVSLPCIPITVVKWVIPISSGFIIVALTLYLVELIRARAPPAAPGDVALADGLR
jgi:hypothetical protein